ncbi:hypothetical protein [Clostridium saccharoperbutylacetonicum]|uniref:hypothetical protein n=1 Tax=Clostridium saccharoperbutylacetonicum TaxID=36745 RepID=UPI00034CD8E4|nr:hypothetical protein [Clostridium saccharoperbutylacetonicum]
MLGLANAKLNCIGQTSWQGNGGLGLAITSMEIGLRKVMAGPFCTGLVPDVIIVYYVTTL